jgi:hypothetical protein
MCQFILFLNSVASYMFRPTVVAIFMEVFFKGVRHPQHTQTGSNSSTIAADSSNGVTNTR